LLWIAGRGYAPPYPSKEEKEEGKQRLSSNSRLCARTTNIEGSFPTGAGGELECICRDRSTGRREEEAKDGGTASQSSTPSLLESSLWASCHPPLPCVFVKLIGCATFPSAAEIRGLMPTQTTSSVIGLGTLSFGAVPAWPGRCYPGSLSDVTILGVLYSGLYLLARLTLISHVTSLQSHETPRTGLHTELPSLLLPGVLLVVSTRLRTSGVGNATLSRLQGRHTHGHK
jgi:hypothetical protein